MQKPKFKSKPSLHRAYHLIIPWLCFKPHNLCRNLDTSNWVIHGCFRNWTPFLSTCYLLLTRAAVCILTFLENVTNPVVTQSWPLFLNKLSLNYPKLFNNFYTSEKVDFDNFCHFFIPFMKNKMFGGPCYAILKLFLRYNIW